MASNRRGISGGRDCRGAAPRSMVRRGMVRLRRIQSGCPRQTHHTGDRARAGRPQDPRSGTAHLLGDAVAPAVSGRLVQTLRLQPVRAAQRVDPLGLVALWSCFWIMRALTGETPIAVLT